jgi:glycosyltransferase involved in cell wall biosynthesis
MFLLYCSDPLHPRLPDEVYAAEIAAARNVGADYALIDFEALVQEDNPQRAVRWVETPEALVSAIYRGWMLTPARYRQLFDALAVRNVRLINDPAAYSHAHYLPENYDLIKAHTPETVWLRTGSDVSMDSVMALLRPFGDKALILKDFVKSQKHHWADACYIPSASDRRAVEAVVRRFLALQGPDLNEGLVFREYVRLEPLATHSKSGMPLTKEYRTFYLDGEPIYTVHYWDEGDYAGSAPPSGLFQDVARTIRSRFFSMDTARRLAGAWTIIELGDGQVAGLPEFTNVPEFYAALTSHWPAEAT